MANGSPTLGFLCGAGIDGPWFLQTNIGFGLHACSSVALLITSWSEEWVDIDKDG